MQTAHELFLHGLSDILDGERRLVEALGKQAEQASNPQLRKAFEQHQQQTQKQVERLERCFQSLGEEPESKECKGIKGLVEEYEEFASEDPAPDLLDMTAATAAAKVERYEISEYESLVRLARMMKHNEAMKLLNQNLKEEQQTLRKVEQLSKRLKPENLGMEEEEEERKPARGARAKGRSRRAA